MSGFQLIRSEVKPLTMEFAREFRDMEASPTERLPKQARLNMLRKKAENGQLVSFHWATALCGEKKYRVNGQHSSLVLSELDGLFPDEMKVHLDEYRVDDEKGLALLFRQFDDRGSGRSAGDVAGSYQGLIGPLRGVNRPSAKLAVEGVVWHRINIEGVTAPSGDDRYELFNDERLHPFIIWVGDLLTKKTTEFKNIGVIAAMYETFSVNPTEAPNFWHLVAREGPDGDDTHPSAVLDAWLVQAENAESKKKLKAGQFYQGCIFAWNAARTDKTPREIKYDTRKGMHHAVE